MSDTSESIAAILAEMRIDADILVFPTLTPDKLRTYADRIEAAADREMSKNCPKNGVEIGQFGNAAAMCAVLKDIRFILRRCVDEGGYCTEEFANLVKWADAALASPARNCDRFQTELDAQLAFLNDVWLISVEKETMLERDKFENWTEQMKTCYGRWLLTPAEKGGTK